MFLNKKSRSDEGASKVRSLFVLNKSVLDEHDRISVGVNTSFVYFYNFYAKKVNNACAPVSYAGAGYELEPKWWRPYTRCGSRP